MRFLSSRLAVMAVAVGLLVQSQGAFAACDPETALYEDDFEFLDVSWGDADESVRVDDGALTVKGAGGAVNLETKSRKDASVCVDISIADAPKPSESPAGLVFGWQDWDNYYAVFVWGDGWLEVRKLTDGKSKTLFTQETKALKTGPGALNSLELNIQPKDTTLFVNSQMVRRFKAKQPKKGGAIGLYGISPKDAAATFTFDDFIVNER